MIINKPIVVQQPTEQSPPTRQRLEMMLMNGEQLNDVVLGVIEKFKLPYRLEIQENGTALLKDTLTPGELFLNTFITQDPETILMKQDAMKMSKVSNEVLITGETGTGKEIIAKAMIGDRKGKFQAINCAGLPETLIESELFGHTAGAFTDARGAKQGLMSAAQDGVMFLDEISELPLHVQGKLLRALQEYRIRKVGSTVDEIINCKFVCASNRNLKEMCEKGLFKKDLYARISTLELDIKPLRERRCDIEPIIKTMKGGPEFLAKYSDELRQGLLDISLNVRSLQQHVIRYSVLGRIVLKQGN